MSLSFMDICIEFRMKMCHKNTQIKFKYGSSESIMPLTLIHVCILVLDSFNEPHFFILLSPWGHPCRIDTFLVQTEGIKRKEAGGNIKETMRVPPPSLCLVPLVQTFIFNSPSDETCVHHFQVYKLQRIDLCYTYHCSML